MNRLSLAAFVLLQGSLLVAQTLMAPFNFHYTWRDLGSVPGVPTPYGGVTFKHDDPDVLLIGGAAITPAGAIYAIRVTRDPNGFINGYVGTATRFSTAPNIDGGLCHGPNGVLFYSAYPVGEIGQIKVGSTAPDRVDSVYPLGATGTPGGLAIVPTGFPGAGEIKTCAFITGAFYGGILAPDGSGTFLYFNGLRGGSPLNSLAGGPQGLLYPPPGSPAIPDYQQIMVCDHTGARVYLKGLLSDGSPATTAPVVFITGVTGVEGVTVDALSGSFLFSTYGGGDRIVLVERAGVCGPIANYGSGIPGAGGRVPTLRGVGCARVGRMIAYQVGNGPAHASGVLNLGFQQLSIPLFGGFVLTEPSISVGHALDGLGSWQLILNLPPNAGLLGRHLYFQAVYLDSGAPFSITASDGLDVMIR
jgi:hypothetical protein